jgi:hypothetical protein
MVLGNPAFPGQLFYKSTANGRFSEACSGDAWAEAEEGINDPTVTPVPVWPFVDGTVVSGDMQTKATPVYISIGNISMEMARKDGSRVLLAYIPQLGDCGFTQKERESVWFKNRSAELMQQVQTTTCVNTSELVFTHFALCALFGHCMMMTAVVNSI